LELGQREEIKRDVKLTGDLQKKKLMRSSQSII